MCGDNHINNARTKKFKYASIQIIYKCIYFNIQIDAKIQNLMRKNLENNYIRIPEDIKFLLEFCRELLRIVKEGNLNNELPVSIEQLKRLRIIEKIYAM